MENGEYYWIKYKDGGDWEIGVMDSPGYLRRCGSRQLATGIFNIGPKVIGPHELIVPAHLLARELEELKDQFVAAVYPEIARQGSLTPAPMLAEMKRLRGLPDDCPAQRLGLICAFEVAEEMLLVRQSRRKLKS